MYTSILLTITLATTILSQSTLSANPITQIEDGQPQAPTGPGPVVPSTEVFVSSSTTVPYSNPFTSYLSETNSLGVVTGMPSVVTSQPAVVTEQPVSPTLPSYSGYAYGNSTTVGVAATTLETVTSETAAASATPEEQSGSGTASATLAQATGGAELSRVTGMGVALVVLGLGFSLL